MNISHHTKNGFRNPWVNGNHHVALHDLLYWRFEALVKNPITKPRWYDIPAIDPDKVHIPARFNSTALTWVGHSTYLIQIDGVNILTDPVWSSLVGPYNKIGPRRKTRPGVPWEKLPRIDIVLISHSHYDHLDEPTVRALKREYDPVFMVPLGVKAILVEWGIHDAQEFDWWNSYSVFDIEYICTPAQHTSRRGAFDIDETLWSGWLINGRDETVYFAGDTGYFPGFEQIRDNNRKQIDVALLPIGAYQPRQYMRTIHMDPGDALTAFRDLNARFFAGMHWGAFDVSNERLDQPPVDLITGAASLGINTDRLWLSALGETKIIPEPYNRHSE